MYKIYVDDDYILTVSSYHEVCVFIAGWFTSAERAESINVFKFDEIKFRIVKEDVEE